MTIDLGQPSPVDALFFLRNSLPLLIRKLYSASLIY
jgi:hypothetical protein